jgi:hypothetical protein
MVLVFLVMMTMMMTVEKKVDVMTLMEIFTFFFFLEMTEIIFVVVPMLSGRRRRDIRLGRCRGCVHAHVFVVAAVTTSSVVIDVVVKINIITWMEQCADEDIIIMAIDVHVERVVVVMMIVSRDMRMLT